MDPEMSSNGRTDEQSEEEAYSEVVSQEGDDDGAHSVITSSSRDSVVIIDVMMNTSCKVTMDPEMSSNGCTDAQSDEEADMEVVSRAGDDGAYSVITSSRRHSEDGSFRHFSMKTETESGDMKQLRSWLEFVSCIIHLSVFGILGVMTRFYLEKVFGPKLIPWTDDVQSVWYLDFPINVIGSFLMGWFGIVFKSNIASVSDQLAIGLTIGYLGSLTTYSGWNQKMLDLSVKGLWGLAALTILIGLGLAALSIFLGVKTAQGARWLFRRLGKSSSNSWTGFRLNTFRRHMVVAMLLLSIWGALWALSVIMETREFDDGRRRAQLWIGCLVGPFGIWIRWRLARLNGRGLGKSRRWKWLPFGTLIANISSACMMAALATLKKAVNTKTSVMVVSGFQIGFMGCLSTIPTMMVELYVMVAKNRLRWAFVYTSITIVVSFGLGTLIYSVPVWVKGYSR